MIIVVHVFLFSAGDPNFGLFGMSLYDGVNFVPAFVLDGEV